LSGRGKCGIVKKRVARNRRPGLRAETMFPLHRHFPERIDLLRLGQEGANALTHGLGLVLSFAGMVLLIYLAAIRGDGWHLVSCSIYGATLVMLYGASTAYHSIQAPRVKGVLKTVDHCCIYLLIAGTYTPFTLTYLRGGWGWTLLCLVWGMALFGLFYKIFFMGRFRALSLTLSLTMGWLAIVAAKPATEVLPGTCVFLMAVGGLFYTAGVYFYAKSGRPYFHMVWHLFVLAGSLAHYLAITLYVIPPA
jgi:hemolysin III